MKEYVHIIAKTKEYLVLDKPAGLAVQGVPGRTEGTLVDWLLKNYPEVGQVGEDAARPGLVHRLDKGTSGVILVARTAQSYNFFKRQFIERHVVKEYNALVWGCPKSELGTIDAPLTRSRRGGFRWRVARAADHNGRPALTEWRLVKSFDQWALLRLWPKTGRTHQIRVHLAHIGHPVAGDPVYAFKNQILPPGLERMFLHAGALTLKLPDGPRHKFEAPLPPALTRVLESI